MSFNGWLQIAFYFAALLLLTRPLGGFLFRVFEGERTLLSPVLGPIERGFYRVAGVDAKQDQSWISYTGAMLAFNALGFLLLYAILRLQNILPLNPQDLPSVSPHLAFNTAVSFVTNTNWQSYGGETTLSYFSQMIGLTTQNFVSAATGIGVALALTRGIARRKAVGIGNFWVDLTRAVLYVLLPLAVISALVLVATGVPQNFSAYTEATTLEGAKQLIAQGPVASQLAIKQLGSNGGGFFNVNSAHPFENPNALSNFLESLYIILIAGALTNTFGRMVKDERQGWALFGAMALLLAAGMATIYAAESSPNPAVAAMGVEGPNMEGKETRFGIAQSAIWAASTTAASNGSVNAMHDSLNPLSGLVTMLNIQLGESIFGGVGAGLYGMLVYAFLTVFIAGLMVGRTPEYLGKKIEAREMKFVMLAILCIPTVLLGFSAWASVSPTLLAGLNNAGPHGFSEILYAFTSAAGNNGSAFAGLTANAPLWDTLLGITMLVGRFAMIVPLLAVAGSLAAKNVIPPSPGTFPTNNGLFVGLLIAIVLIVGGLTFFPALALGPIAEHLAMRAGQAF
ncbi:MAG: potassium-transporting ATPase subunit KdpA [Thiobacillus sp.]|nr:potassium-transporting ATPase subunit KdpA [Thiobacillus sp.]